MLHWPDSLLKFIRCNYKTGTDAASGKRCYRKNEWFCVIVCGQCDGEAKPFVKQTKALQASCKQRQIVFLLLTFG